MIQIVFQGCLVIGISASTDCHKFFCMMWGNPRENR